MTLWYLGLTLTGVWGEDCSRVITFRDEAGCRAAYDQAVGDLRSGVEWINIVDGYELHSWIRASAVAEINLWSDDHLMRKHLEQKEAHNALNEALALGEKEEGGQARRRN